MGTEYDVITVGGGLGGSALAKVLAENGKRVLVIERERQFADRIRGEWLAPWGGVEAQRLGLYHRLLEQCAHESPFFLTVGSPRDLRTTTPQRLPPFNALPSRDAGDGARSGVRRRRGKSGVARRYAIFSPASPLLFRSNATVSCTS
jgi:choline dehydrogenase-like flavoprotein